MTSGATLSALLLTWTFITGVMDALSMLALGRVFTALMTGNVVFVGLSFAGESEFSALRSCWALGAFAAGAVLGGALARAHKASPLRAWLLTAATLEALLLFASAAMLWASQPEGNVLYGVIALTAAAMGLRSATVVPLADPDLKTTVLTLTITALAADSRLARGTGLRWQRRALSIALLCLGACAGALSLRALGLSMSLAAAGLLVWSAAALFAIHPSAAQPWRGQAR